MNTIVAKLTYLPFVGWMFPMAMIKEEEVLLHHVKQAFLLAFVFAGTLIVLNFVLVMAPRGEGYFRYGLVISIYFLYLLYFILCLVGTGAVLRSRKLNIPLVHNYAERLNI